jgi:hypothetical protein
MKLALFVVAVALVAAVLIGANWGAGDGPSYPSRRQPLGVPAGHTHRAVAARKGPPISGLRRPARPADGRLRRSVMRVRTEIGRRSRRVSCSGSIERRS